MNRVDEAAIQAIEAENEAVLNLFQRVTEEFNLHNFDRQARSRVWHRLDQYVGRAYVYGEGDEGNPFPHAPKDGMWTVSPSPKDDHGESDDLVMTADPELDRLLAEEEEIERAAELIRLHQEQEQHNEEE